MLGSYALPPFLCLLFCLFYLPFIRTCFSANPMLVAYPSRMHTQVLLHGLSAHRLSWLQACKQACTHVCHTSCTPSILPFYNLLKPQNPSPFKQFIDEIHLVMGAGKAEGAMDAANLLKPMLARGELHCIGATTLAEYRQHIEKDAALERRFQQVGLGLWGLWCRVLGWCGVFGA